MPGSAWTSSLAAATGPPNVLSGAPITIEAEAYGNCTGGKATASATIPSVTD